MGLSENLLVPLVRKIPREAARTGEGFTGAPEEKSKETAAHNSEHRG